MPNQFKFGSDARNKLLAGAKLLSDAVTTTLGPKGRNVSLGKKWGPPHVVHDGVTVARDLELEDPFENQGAQLIKEASSKTNDRAGDGTTTATLLAYEIVRRGMELLEDPQVNPMGLKKGIDAATETVVAELKQLSKPISTKEEIEQVATVSAANPELGKMIAEAMEKVGKNGVITVEPTSALETTTTFTEGMEIERGYASSHLVTDDKKMEVEIIQPLVFVTDYPLRAMTDISDWLGGIVNTDEEPGRYKDIVIIADTIEGDALTFLTLNKAHGSLHPLAVNAPAMAERRKQILEDIAILTGATFYSRGKGLHLSAVTRNVMGGCSKVWADKDRTRIIGGYGRKEDIAARIKQIETEIEKSESAFEKERLQDRIARLSGGVAVIKVGANSETELNEKKERAIDAVEATKSAVAEGIIPGGGTALIQARKVLTSTKTASPEEEKGRDILFHALEAPFKKILVNAGFSEQAISQHLATLNEQTSTFGVDVETGRTGDLIELGIVDPTKVTRSAVENATSVASMILTTDVLIDELPAKMPVEAPESP